MSFEPDGVSRKEYDRLIAQVADVMKLRLEDKLAHCNVMGRIAVALFGDQNNRTDEECVARAAEVGYELEGAKTAVLRATGKEVAWREMADKRGERVSQLERKRDLLLKWLAEAETDMDALRHDIARHVQIAAEQAQELEQLRQDLAAARDEAKISEDALQSACVKALNERDQLRQNLAAARALLRDCRSLVRCESLDHYRKADQHDGFGPCPIEMRMKYAIDAAIAGEKK